MEIIDSMYWNAMFCGSGDNTLSAAKHAVGEVLKEEADDYFVFLLSDANLNQYGITAKALSSSLMFDKRVNAFAIFIAREETAQHLVKSLPAGKAFVVMNTSKLPLIFKQIFTSSLLKQVGKPKL